MDAQTCLSELIIPYLDVVLDEIFHVPPVDLFPELGRPATVGALASLAGLSVSATLHRLKEIEVMSVDIEITPAALAQRLQANGAGVILVDVRADWEFEICHLPGSLLLATEVFADLLPKLVQAPLTVTICHHGMRSYSAAMYLRQQGVATACSLAGGVDAWAKDIDPTMAKY